MIKSEGVKTPVSRVAELGSLSSGAKMAMEIFVKRVFTIFASNASFLLYNIKVVPILSIDEDRWRRWII